MVTGEILEVSKGVECRTEHVPLGVVASIVPFNFPSMVPNWTIPNAIALGNCMIMKPSEKVPLSVGRLAELLKEAGLPDGVFNIVHGDVEIVEAICDHPGIEAVSFVGSTKVAKIVYQRATKIIKEPCIGWRKKSFDGFAGCNTGYDCTKCGGKYEWLCRTALHGSICHGRCW